MVAARAEVVRSGTGDLFWRWGLQALLVDWQSIAQPWARWQAGGRGARGSQLDNPPLSHASEGQEVV